MSENPFARLPRPVSGKRAPETPAIAEPTPKAAAKKKVADFSPPPPAKPRTSRRRLVGMIGGLAIIGAAAFVARPIVFESADDDPGVEEVAESAAHPTIILGKSAVSLGSPADKIKTEDSVADVGSLVWRDPSERTVRRQKEARRKAATGVKQRTQTRGAVPIDQSPIVVRGKVIVPTSVDEEGPLLAAPETSLASGGSSSRETAQQLVREARAALTEGRVDEAKQKALAADRLNTAFALFEDRPSAILAEIARMQPAASVQESAEPRRTAELSADRAPVLTDPIPIDPVPHAGQGEPAPSLDASVEEPAPELARTEPAGEAPSSAPALEFSTPATQPAPVEPQPEMTQTAPAKPQDPAPAQISEPQWVQQPLATAPAPNMQAPAGTPSVRILPAESRNPIPDDGTRLSFDFHAAPWEFVLTQFAAKIKLPLDMTLVPAGTLTYVDHKAYSPQETLNTLNVLLIEKGFTMIHRNGKLVLKAQPSAISSRTDGRAEGSETQGGVGSKAESAALLADARRDISQGRLNDAQRKAQRAAQLNAVFGLLEDRPETVLDEIRRVAAEPQQLMREPPGTALPGSGDPWLYEKRMSINFKNAGWELVLREFAKSAGLQLQMDETPNGSFSHVDSSIYSPAETMEILNGFLARSNFRMTREGDVLRVSRLEQVWRGLR